MIALNCLFAIASYGQTVTDKFCFTGSEMNFWINSVYDAKTYHTAYDSMRIAEVKYKEIIKTDSVVISGANRLIQTKDNTIEVINQYSKGVEAQVKKERFFKIVWKSVAGALGIYEVYNLIQNRN